MSEIVPEIGRVIIVRCAIHAINRGAGDGFTRLLTHGAYVIAKAGDFVPDGLGVNNRAGWVGLGFIESVHAVGIDREAACGGFGNHPKQSDIGQAGLRVTATDVGVYSGEPDLLENLTVGTLAAVPYGGLKWLAVFVDGERLKGVVDPAAQGHVVKGPAFVDELQNAADRKAESSDGIPDAHKFSARFPGIAATKQFGFDSVGMRSVVTTTVERVGVLQFVRKRRLEQAAIAYETEGAADGIGAAAESQKEELVAGGIGFHQEKVSIHDLFLDAPAEGAAANAVEAAGADSFVVEHELLDLVGIGWEDAAGDFRDVAGADLSVVNLIGAIPSTVAADDDALHELTLRELRRRESDDG